MSHFSALFLNRIFQNLFYFQKGFENGRKKLILKKNWLKKQKKPFSATCPPVVCLHSLARVQTIKVRRSALRKFRSQSKRFE